MTTATLDVFDTIYEMEDGLMHKQPSNNQLVTHNQRDSEGHK